MSEFMLSNETLSMIANVIERHYSAGFNSFGFCLTGEMEQYVFDYCEKPIGLELFKKLAELNKYSLMLSYGDEENVKDMVGDVMYIPSVDIWQKYKGKVDIWHYQLLKSLDCYLYQTGKIVNFYHNLAASDIDEQRLMEQTRPMIDLYISISAYRNEIADYIVTHSANYKQAKWG